MNAFCCFINSTIGRKILMALSGLVLVGFVMGHMLGNLQIFLGAEAINAYALSFSLCASCLGALGGSLVSICLYFGPHLGGGHFDD